MRVEGIAFVKPGLRLPIYAAESSPEIAIIAAPERPYVGTRADIWTLAGVDMFAHEPTYGRIAGLDRRRVSGATVAFVFFSRLEKEKSSMPPL